MGLKLTTHNITALELDVAVNPNLAMVTEKHAIINKVFNQKLPFLPHICFGSVFQYCSHRPWLTPVSAVCLQVDGALDLLATTQGMGGTVGLYQAHSKDILTGLKVNRSRPRLETGLIPGLYQRVLLKLRPEECLKNGVRLVM